MNYIILALCSVYLYGFSIGQKWQIVFQIGFFIIYITSLYWFGKEYKVVKKPKKTNNK